MTQQQLSRRAGFHAPRDLHRDEGGRPARHHHVHGQMVANRRNPAD